MKLAEGWESGAAEVGAEASEHPGSARAGGRGSGPWAGSAAAPLLTDAAVLLTAARRVVPQPRVQHHDAVLLPLRVIGLSRVPVAAKVEQGVAASPG